MFASSAKNSLSKRIIAVFIILQFVAGSAVAKGFAAQGNLRAKSTVNNDNRLGSIRRALNTYELNKIGRTDTIPGKDNRDGGADVFKDILGEDYKASPVKEKLAFNNYVQQQIDLGSGKAKEELTRAFGEIKDGDSFYTVSFANLPLAIVKKDKNGELTIKKVIEDLDIPLGILTDEAEDLKAKGINVADVLVRDFRILEKRSHVDIPHRLTVEFSELRDYVYELAEKVGKEEAMKAANLLVGNTAASEALIMDLVKEKKRGPGRDKAKEVGLGIAGGKGLSLSVMSQIEGVKVPNGYNVTTTAYFKFVKDRKNVWEKIFNELQALDTMDDQKRNVKTEEIRKEIEKTSIPDDIKAEVTAMYHQLSISRYLTGNPAPAPVAVRSSGTKEDIKINTWLEGISTGSQAGQSDTFLSIKGESEVLEKLSADWASLFTDRAVSYRDDATFLQFMSSIDFNGKDSQKVYWGIVAKLNEYANILGKPEYKVYATLMSSKTSPNPGSVNLMNAMAAILEKEPGNAEMRNALDVLKNKSLEVVHPEQIGIDVVIMQMVNSYISGVLFTVNPATKMAGVAQALDRAWKMNDYSLVHKDPKTGAIIGTKSVVVSFDAAFGYGENVVGGKVNPDKFIMGTENGDDWFVIEKRKGNKLIHMKDRSRVSELLSHKITEKDQEEFAKTVKKAIAYDEAGKRINAIIATNLQGVKYLKPPKNQAKEESPSDKKTRLQVVANEIANMVKDKDSEAQIVAFIKDNFIVETREGFPGIQEKNLSKFVKEAYKDVSEAQTETDEGMKILGEKLGDLTKADTFIQMVKEVWENKELNLPHRQEVLDRLGMTKQEQRDFSYYIRAFIDKSRTANKDTATAHQNTFTLTDDQAQHVARMGWAIAEFYKDARDIEFAIEIDKTATGNDAVKLYIIDDHGDVQGMDEKGNLVTVKNEVDKARIKEASLRLYNVQARPYTAEYLKTDVIRARTEVDEKWLEDHPEVKPIASGTKGENATHGYVIRFDSNKDVAWHAELIYRLKAGDFTEKEKEQIRAIGLNPDDYGPGSEQQLPIILYLLEADPNHDPIMRLVNSVVTIRGGDTCHAAIFCREQGIPAVTGAGKVMLRGHLLETGDGLTVDANNGNIYEMDPDKNKRIPINYVEFDVKGYLIPRDPDGMPTPDVGLIIAATSAAQQNSPIMLATDSAGNSLTRAEFKGEEIGINVYAGYGHNLLQQIKAGKIKRPNLVLISDLISGKAGVSIKFIDAINREAALAFQKSSEANEAFRNTFGRKYNLRDGISLLRFFDLQRDIRFYGLAAIEKTMTFEDRQLLQFVPTLPKETLDVLEYLYGAAQRKYNYDYNIIADLERHPWILQEVENKLKEKGYETFEQYVSKEFLYFYNLMGFCISSKQTAKDRAYDFAQDKIRGMPGSEIFSWPGVNPLVGLRGTSLEIEAFDEEFGGNQKVLGFLFDSVIEAHKNTKNQAWFYVFVRSIRELETLDQIIELKAKQAGMLPKEIGIMIEVPSAALDVKALAKKLSDMGKKYKKYGVEHTFFSFGTNDYSHLAGMGDREDPRMKLEIMDPAAIAAMIEIKQAGYFCDVKGKILPLIDEGADVMLQLIETVVASAGDEDVVTSLCGEAITALVNRGDYKTAGKIMILLDSFGVSMMKVRLPASMTKYDVMATVKTITVPEAKRRILVDLAQGRGWTQESGVVKGEIIYVDSIDDLLPEALKGLKGPELKKQREFLKLQSLDSARNKSARTFEKIAVITKNLVAFSQQEIIDQVGANAFGYLTSQFLSNDALMKRLDNGLYVWTNLNVPEKKFKEELESSRLDKEEQDNVMKLWQKAWDNSIAGLKRRNIDWGDLQYTVAILVDENVDLEGWDVFSKDRSINASRIKAYVKGVGAQRKQLEGKFVTIDYGAKKLYDGNLAVSWAKAPLRRLPVPETRPLIEELNAVSEDANSVYAKMVYHPRILLAYLKKDWTEQGKIFDEYVSKLVEEVKKVTEEGDNLESAKQKRDWSLNNLKNKVSNIPEPMIRQFMKKVIADAEEKKAVSLPDNWMDTLRERYFADLDNGIAKMLGKNTPEQFITGLFMDSMRRAIEKNPGQLVVHKTTSLNCVVFNNMRGGFLVEQVNPNPDYGILGAARAIGDMWEINRMELKAFKEVLLSLSADKQKDFALQITNLKGTQSGAVMIAWREVLKDMDIIPGKNGMQVGVNMSTPADTMAVDKYFEYFKTLGTGLSFISYDTMKLGAAWAGVDIYWNEWRRLAREEELVRFGTMAAWMAEAKVAALKGKVLTFDQKPAAQALLQDGGAITAAKYGKIEESLTGLIGLSAEQLEKSLHSSWIKFDKNTLKVLPFDGISVIHDITANEKKSLRGKKEEFEKMLKDAGLSGVIAFVEPDSYHVTTFDLVCVEDILTAGKRNTQLYKRVRADVEKAALEFMQKEKPLTVKAKVVGLSMFAPTVLKLDVVIDDVTMEQFNAFRKSLNNQLIEVDGYHRTKEGLFSFSAHMTFGYLVNPMSKDEITKFIKLLSDFNDKFTPVEFEMTKGAVMEFPDMNHFTVLDGGTFVAQREVIENLFRAIMDRYNALQPGQELSLSKEEMEGVLWTLNALPGESAGDQANAIKSLKNIENVLASLSDAQKSALQELSQGMIFANHGLDIKVQDILLKVMFNTIQESETTVFKALINNGFGNFVNSLQGLENSSGGLVIGANTVFENAGTLSALKRIKAVQPGLKIVFWAKDNGEAKKLKALGAESVTNIVIADSLTEALKVLKEFQVENTRIVLVNSDLDNQNIEKEFQVKNIEEFLAKPEVKGVRAVAVKYGSAFAGGTNINSMPLVLARATAAVYKDENKVIKQYEKLSQNSGLSEDTLKALNDLDQALATVPLVSVSQDIAKAQATYEKTIKETESKI